jgi:hypothetical protein
MTQGETAANLPLTMGRALDDFNENGRRSYDPCGPFGEMKRYRLDFFEPPRTE